MGTTLFLTLPPELKDMIFEMLLTPITPFKPPRPYEPAPKPIPAHGKKDDKAPAVERGRLESQPPLPHIRESTSPGFPYRYGLHPAILRVNQQLHYEATEYLYQKLDCEIDFYDKDTEDLEGQVHQQYFFRDPSGRTNSLEHTRVLTRAGRMCYVQVFAPKRQCNWTGFCAAKDVLNLSCLWSIPNITIVVSWSAIFGQGNWTKFEANCNHRFTHMGTLLLEVLRHINDEPVTKTTKELLITTKGGELLKTFVKALDLWRIGRVPRDVRMKALYDGINEIITLLRSIKTRSSVSITEKAQYDTKEDLNWESFPWSS